MNTMWVAPPGGVQGTTCTNDQSLTFYPESNLWEVKVVSGHQSTSPLTGDRQEQRKRQAKRTWMIVRTKSEFLNRGVIDFSGQIMLCLRGRRPVHCRAFAVSPASTHQMPAASLPSCDNQNWLQTLPKVPWGAKSPLG